MPATLEATLAQPTGASRLCLGCHDGTTALGNLRVPPRIGPVSLGPLTGRASLGTDLSDDHPVSFVFDSALALRQGQLADPSSLPATIRLDRTKQMQCSSCHDPHESRHRKFLRVDDRGAGLCTTCHRQKNWIGVEPRDVARRVARDGHEPLAEFAVHDGRRQWLRELSLAALRAATPSPPERQPGGEGLPRVPRRERGGDEARPGVPETQRAPCHLDQLDPRAPRGTPPSCPAT